MSSPCYFFSGGLKFRQRLLPTVAQPAPRALERAGRPLSRHSAFHQLITIRKR